MSMSHDPKRPQTDWPAQIPPVRFFFFLLRTLKSNSPVLQCTHVYSTDSHKTCMQKHGPKCRRLVLRSTVAQREKSSPLVLRTWLEAKEKTRGAAACPSPVQHGVGRSFRQTTFLLESTWQTPKIQVLLRFHQSFVHDFGCVI